VIAFLGLSCEWWRNLWKPKQRPEAKREWTVIGYFDGNCNLDGKDPQDPQREVGFSWAIWEVQQMQKVGSSDKVAIIVQVSSKRTGGVATRYYIEKKDDVGDNISSKKIGDVGSVDMSNPRTLSDFIKWAKSEYPAKKYIVIIMDHGDGWRGACIDEVSGGGHMMTLKEINQAFQESGKCDIIAFNACLMAMLEVAYELRDKASFLVASQNVQFVQSFGYAGWLAKLIKTPQLSPRALCIEMCNAAYDEAYQKGLPATISAFELSKIPVIASAVDELGKNIGPIFRTPESEAAKAIITIRGATNMCVYQPEYVDLYDFCLKLRETFLNHPAIKNSAQRVMDTLINARVLVKNTVQSARNGLSIYFPDNQNIYRTPQGPVRLRGYDIKYDTISFASTTWDEFLKKFNKEEVITTEETGELEILSQPQGAAIYVNGVDQKATTPCKFTRVPPGTYTIKLTLRGYKDWEEQVTVEKGKTTRVEAVLEQKNTAHAILVINSTPQGATIWINNQNVGKVTPQTLEFHRAGTYTVRLTLQGYQDWEQQVILTLGQTTQINATLQPITQQLTVTITRFVRGIVPQGETGAGNPAIFFEVMFNASNYVLTVMLYYNNQPAWAQPISWNRQVEANRGITIYIYNTTPPPAGNYFIRFTGTYQGQSYTLDTQTVTVPAATSAPPRVISRIHRGGTREIIGGAFNNSTPE
jgi:hypothetical protein